MRVLVLSNLYPPRALGGYELSCRDVVDRWRAAGHEVLVLSGDAPVGEGAAGDDPSHVRPVLQLYWEDHRILNPPLRQRWVIERSNTRALEDVLADFRPEVASVWNMGAMSMGLLSRLGRRGIPVVSVICDEWPFYGPRVDAWLRPLAGRPRLARVIGSLTGLETRPPPLDDLGPALFVSDWLRRVVRERSSWAFPDSAVVPSGIDPADFPLVQPEDREGFSWRLLSVGRIDPRKGFEVVIRALPLLPPEATLEIIGGGEEAHRLELAGQAARLGVADRVRFDVVPRSELSGRYRAADAVIFPSAWEEPFGLVPLEAMASGTPVVAVPSGGSAEFLAEGANCLTFPPGDAPALAAALGRLAGDGALRSALRAGGQATAARFSVDRLASDLLEHHLRVAVEGSPVGA